MHWWCNSPRDFVSSFRSDVATAISPSADAFFSPACALTCLALFISLFKRLSFEVKSFIISSKLNFRLVSCFRTSTSWASALSSRACRVSTMLLPPSTGSCPSLPKAATAAASSCRSCSRSSDDAPVPLWINATNVEASADRTDDASTIALSASTNLCAPSDCKNDALPFGSRSRMAMARCSMSVVSERSFSSVKKLDSSYCLIFVIAFKSAWIVDDSAEISPIFVSDAEMRSACSSMTACRLLTSDWDVLMSWCNCLDRSAHHLAKSEYVFCADSPCTMSFCCMSAINSNTFSMG
mmetsp:Transcript_74540/g.215401  ORF Transcript_74540/g.215401 Transcript_74540/m.215401 type:complete len:296 (-) Transcript_74540:117-1004(-)